MTADNGINQILNIQKIRQDQQSGVRAGAKNVQSRPFEEILKETAKANELTAGGTKIRQYAFSAQTRELTFSKHAKQRLAQRNIDIDTGLIEKIGEAVGKASEKNIKNALVLSDESAFIVNVDSSVVVTAMNYREMRENVITNIDGTVIL